MKFDWIDFNIGLFVQTKKGSGILKSIDEPNNEIGVLLKGKIEKFGIDEIGMPLGSLSINLTQQIGQYILLFQRIENRLRDFTNKVLDLNTVQQKELTTFFTAGKLIDKIGVIIQKYSEKDVADKWKTLGQELRTLNGIRNTIVHGYLFHYNKNHELDFKNIRIQNANGNEELLDFEKLYDLNRKVTELYYKIHSFISNESDKLQTVIKNYR